MVNANTSASSTNINRSVVKFKPTDDEDTLIARGAAVVSSGDTNIYIGTNQVSSNNQDPIIASFTNGERDWVTTNIETTGADSRGVALLWGSDGLYAAFTTDGTQGSAEEDFRRFTDDGWLSSYGQGGGAKATVLLRIDPSTGFAIAGNGTFVSAVLSNGNTNSLIPTNLAFAGDNIVLEADSYFSPRRVDTTSMDRTIAASSPFNYTITFDRDLKTAKSAIAPGWDDVPLEAEAIEPNLELITINRFYEYEKGFHFYTGDEIESNFIRRESEAGNLSYSFEGESFTALSSNLDLLTGEAIAAAEPVFRFFNRDTGAHLFTMDVKEKDYILNNLPNYQLEGTAYYGFETQPEAIATIPIYRMLNRETGTHLFTSDRNEFEYVRDNFNHFSTESNNGVAFQVLASSF